MNVALPALQEDLGASLAAQQWVVEAYLLTLSSLLLVGGSLDDLFDRRTVFARRRRRVRRHLGALRGRARPSSC